MRIAGLVLARKSSKSIPGKNKRLLGGQPLICWVLRPMIDAAVFCGVWVSTDDEDIAAIAGDMKVNVHRRLPADDTQRSVDGVSEFLHAHPDLDGVCLVQCTSPLLHPRYLTLAYNMLINGGYDSIFSVSVQHQLRWSVSIAANDELVPLNFDPKRRPRRQEWPGEFVESGHFYMARSSLIRDKVLLQGGKIGVVELPDEFLLEVDTPNHWKMAEVLVQHYGYDPTREE